MIEEIVKLIPNKPIRFLVNTHQHFDHIGGLRTYMHIGATIITHWKNFDFYNRDVLNYAPRTLEPDMVSLWPPTELAEGYQYETVRENYVLSDGTPEHAHLLRAAAGACGRHVDGVSAEGEDRDRSRLVRFVSRKHHSNGSESGHFTITCRGSDWMLQRSRRSMGLRSHGVISRN